MVIAHAGAAHALGVELKLGRTGQVVAERSFDAVGSNDWISLLDLRLGYHFKGGLGFTLDYETGKKTGTVFQSIGSTLYLDSLAVGVQYTRRPFVWLRPYARAGVDILFAELRFRSPTDERHSQWLARPAAFLSSGVDFMLANELLRKHLSRLDRPWLKDAAIGISIEAGWTFRPELEFSNLESEAAGGSSSIPHTGVNAGTLDLDGFVIRGGMAFMF